MRDILPLLPGDTVACLRLADDRRRFPFRPLSSGLFLIGSGPSCDLRLGEAGMPAIHSVLDVNRQSAKLLKVAAGPELVVNGEPIEQCTLQNGDLIEIGAFRSVWQSLNSEESLLVTETQKSAAEMSADELLEQLQAEMHLVESVPSDRGKIRELLEAAHKAVETQPFQQTLRFEDYAARRNQAAASDPALDVVLSRLTAQENRLGEICQVLEEVVRQQQMIATALQYIADRLDSGATGTDVGVRRASA